MNNLTKLLSRLDKVKRIGNDRYIAICPAHDDHNPSLAIKDSDDFLLLHCFCGCETAEILSAIGLTFNDIMPNQAKGDFKRIKKPFYALDILGIVQFEASLVYLYATDIAKGLKLKNQDKERLLLAASRINYAYGVAKHGL